MTPLRILIVDDDASISVLLAEILEAMGHVVCGMETTETGAVQASLDTKPDLLLIDVNLRGGSGVAAVTAIEQTASIPFIFMSGGRLPRSLGKAVTLQKPFMPRDLFDAIERTTSAAFSAGAPC